MDPFWKPIGFRNVDSQHIPGDSRSNARLNTNAVVYTSNRRFTFAMYFTYHTWTNT